MIIAVAVAIGEWVTAVQSHSSNDAKFLSFEKGDVIEVVEIYGDGTIKVDGRRERRDVMCVAGEDSTRGLARRDRPGAGGISAEIASEWI